MAMIQKVITYPTIALKSMWNTKKKSHKNQSDVGLTKFRPNFACSFNLYQIDSKGTFCSGFFGMNAGYSDVPLLGFKTKIWFIYGIYGKSYY